MGKTFTLQISTPDKQFYNGEAESLVVTTTDGEIGVLAGHAPLVAALVAAPVHIKLPGGEWREAAISGGFVNVAGSLTEIFADTAEWPEDIEESRALEAKKRAEERLKAQLSGVEYMRSRVALERALTRLEVRHSKYE